MSELLTGPLGGTAISVAALCLGVIMFRILIYVWEG